MKHSKRKALYPGSFDPITYGHLDLIKRALALFDEVYVAIATNEDKVALFSVAERVEMMQRALKGLKRVHVHAFDGLSVAFARKHNIQTLIRGLRATSDFDYEFQMAMTNRTLAKDIDTIFLMPSEKHFYLSSKLVKEIAKYGGNVDTFVPPFVMNEIKKKLM
ncbi:MAG: pantetheine-phosphate adenylyltransferase [Candidatus Omnitrophica bacterium CG11_big_fil_rev_8_21_14_0_20_45_26]|uniref:Phosphopantetheine adenylyltransferase n=1 Tax=Candidatus Abzuiibacterium crystallinum TaxID=1974748 RepID=A0A2H0LUX0_9BACT|nr:MAG: pantetheine-phosphate adenylyltransferase [Candidatus Omnitrophica bacterium CG11_big_fil_rev_8_21_14_0_20_45_26]PIW65044.1 MAG: pantetheine-phosphate adenylyltransferase [Candidatus Omnitrophica bacterium CG12_big_fil_rev_8_21_14_0_65_45_16]